MVASLFLPRNDRAIESYQLGPASPYGMSHVGSFPRIVYAAAHVVADPLASHDPWSDCAIDWETTLAFRHHLWRAAESSELLAGFFASCLAQIYRR